MELDTTVAARWCRKQKVPSRSPEVEHGLRSLSEVLYQAICKSTLIPPPEIRVYYQSMKCILRVANDQAQLPERRRAARRNPSLLGLKPGGMMNIELFPARAAAAPTLFTPTPKTAKRVLEFFTAQVNNDHTRKAYLNATRRFAEWCATHNIGDLASVQPFHIAAFIKELQGQLSPPTVKQNLAALRMLFDWLGVPSP
jgi:hypothetical protein